MNNEERFNGLEKYYDLHRPDYPEEMYETILQTLSAKENPVIADVGIGTGKSALWFLKNGFRVKGIEPNADMYSMARKMRRKFPDLSLFHATAEETGLPDKSVDLIISGQAIQYFEIQKVGREFKRILTQKGRVAVFWNAEDPLTEWEEAYYQTITAYRYKDKRDLRETRPEKAEFLFRDGKFVFFRFKNHQVLDKQALIGRTFSSSHSPRQHTEAHAELTRRLEQLMQGRNEICLHYIVNLYVGIIESAAE